MDATAVHATVVTLPKMVRVEAISLAGDFE